MNSKLLKSLTTLALAFSISSTFFGCNKDSLKNCVEHQVSPCNEDANKTNISKNNSKYDFCNVEINPSTGRVNCGIIKKGESTCYRSFDTAFRYAYIKLSINGKEFISEPDDYVGETPLGVGKFIYVLDIPDFNSTMPTLTLVKE